MAKFSLVNKNILVTGASSGIGASCCIECSELGANIILIGRSKEKLNSVYKQLKPANHFILSFDLMNLTEIEKALEEPLDKYGEIHGSVHSAGIDKSLPLSSLKQSDYLSLFNTNVLSGIEIARILSSKQYLPNEGASYIFIASVLGMLGRSGTIAYSSSKGALLAACRSMALELSAKKIRINCISPGIVRTELTEELFKELPQGAMEKLRSLHPLDFGSPVDIANACVYFLSDESKWITGSNFVIDGGYSCQ
jgi:NAD(P)-dependent dehydrogenase (short-subunit alcohol dehydrogenase family)